MLKINLYKIIFILQKETNPIITGELASLTKINFKNIGRYLNFLEEKGLIDREINQVKKKRYIQNSLTWDGENFIIPDIYQKFLEKFYES